MTISLKITCTAIPRDKDGVPEKKAQIVKMDSKGNEHILGVLSGEGGEYNAVLSGGLDGELTLREVSVHGED